MPSDEPIWVQQENNENAELAVNTPTAPPTFENVPTAPPTFENVPTAPPTFENIPTAPPTFEKTHIQNPVFSETNYDQVTNLSPMANFNQIATITNSSQRKGFIMGGGAIAFLLVSALVIALLPPGVIPMMDEMRDRDDDGLTDAEELELGTSPNKADTDGDGLLDPDEDCPAGMEDWESTYGSDYDGDGCKDSNEDIDDDDDGIADGVDECPRGRLSWTSSSSNDFDGDGCKDSVEDDDDDDDGWSDSLESDCETDSKNRYEKPLDWDGDGVCDYLDSDDDNDGCLDWNDEFPLDASECIDTDNDGIGNNADPDDDNDGYSDSLENSCISDPLDRWEWPPDFDEDGECDHLDSDDDNDGVYDWDDVNDRADTGVLLTLDSFKPIEKMDYFDNQAEIYICVYLEDISLGCAPDGEYVWGITTGATRTLNFKFFADLPETQRYHYFKITVWDDDVAEDDRMDINPDSGWDSYTFHYDSLMGTIDESTYASGTGDGNGYDGALWFSVDAQDLREQRYTQFIWEYDNGQYWVNLNLDYDTYSAAKNSHPSTHTGCMGVDCSVYADPDAQYIINLANTLYNLAREFGHTSSHDIAEFIYAFVGSIQYERDIDGVAQYEYPKYPIEMLWEGAGDCEDAAILYVSLVEALGYDAILVRMFTKQTEDSEWGGHFMAGIDVSGGSGAYFYYNGGPKSGIEYWMVETTGWTDGVSEIGRNPWHDMKDYTLYDVEES
jgi:hypothetical protein